MLALILGLGSSTGLADYYFGFSMNFYVSEGSLSFYGSLSLSREFSDVCDFVAISSVLKE